MEVETLRPPNAGLERYLKEPISCITVEIHTEDRNDPLPLNHSYRSNIVVPYGKVVTLEVLPLVSQQMSAISGRQAIRRLPKEERAGIDCARALLRHRGIDEIPAELQPYRLLFTGTVTKDKGYPTSLYLPALIYSQGKYDGEWFLWWRPIADFVYEGDNGIPCCVRRVSGPQ